MKNVVEFGAQISRSPCRNAPAAASMSMVAPLSDSGSGNREALVALVDIVCLMICKKSASHMHLENPMIELCINWG